MSKSVPQKDVSKIDLKALEKVLFQNSECPQCPLIEKFKTKTECSNCPYYPSSRKGLNKSVKGKRPCVAISAKVFKPMGITTYNPKNNTVLGKSHLYMYHYYPSLKWQPPPLPEVDRFGKPVKPTAVFELAHLDGNEHNDRKNNLFWMLKNEHKCTEKNKSVRKKKEKVDGN